MIPAISDASGPEPRAFTYEWFQGEEPERQKQMTDLAKQQIRAYVADRAKGKITAKPVPAQGARRVAAAKVQEPILENVKMVTYDLWNSNQPVLILSAEAHLPPPNANTAHAEAADPDLQYSIMLVAYPDIYKNLHKLYAGVTDKFHLDVTPRMELIDAVDADGDGRGELLFRETSDSGAGWVIYRATADKLWKMFDSLNQGIKSDQPKLRFHLADNSNVTGIGKDSAGHGEPCCLEYRDGVVVVMGSGRDDANVTQR